MQWDRLKFEILKTDHFDVYYYPEEQQAAEQVARMAERWYSRLSGILRHEIGHALGLNHASDQTSVMYRESATTTIAPSDRATLRLLYLVPPGSLR